MTGLPKKYIKKYGVSKKAWAEFRKAKKSRSVKRRTGRKRRATTTMPRRKRSRRSYVRKARKSYSRRKSVGITNKHLIGMALTSTVDGLVDPFLGNFPINISDDLLKLGLGWYLMKKQKNKYVQGVGIGMLSRGLGNVVGNVMTGGLNLFGGASVTNGTGSNIIS